MFDRNNFTGKINGTKHSLFGCYESSKFIDNLKYLKIIHIFGETFDVGKIESIRSQVHKMNGK